MSIGKGLSRKRLLKPRSAQGTPWGKGDSSKTEVEKEGRQVSVEIWYSIARYYKR